MRSEKISFANNSDEQLAAVIEWPEQVKPLGFAIFAHCFTCTKNNPAAVHISRALSKRGIAVLRFDFTGLGSSEGDFATAGFSHNIADLIAASHFLEKHHQPAQILIGHSLGGAAVLHAASQIPSARAIATIGAPYDPAHALHLFDGIEQALESADRAEVNIGGRPFTVSRHFIEDMKKQSPDTMISSLDAALMVMHAPLDNVVGIDNAALIYKVAKHPKNFISLDLADHLLSRKEDSWYAAEMIATWADRYLAKESEPVKIPPAIDGRVTVRTPAGGFYTDMYANGHNLVADEPTSYGGTNLGPTPYDYLQASLAACTSMTVQMYAQRKKWPLEDVVVRMRYEKVHINDCEDCEDPGRKIDHFERELEFIGPLSDDQRQRLLEIAEKCPVHKTLMSETSISTVLRHA